MRQFDEHRDLDVIVTDVVMPGVGGVEMVSRIRARVPDVPVVFVSGYTAEDRDLPLDPRTAFVPKPYAMATLCGAIESVRAVATDNCCSRYLVPRTRDLWAELYKARLATNVTGAALEWLESWVFVRGTKYEVL